MGTHKSRWQPEDPRRVADYWRAWCGDTPWSRALDAFGELGGQVIWWCGYPRSASAIPLAFELIMPDGSHFNTQSRLKDIRAAIKAATSAT